MLFHYKLIPYLAKTDTYINRFFAWKEGRKHAYGWPPSDSWEDVRCAFNWYWSVVAAPAVTQQSYAGAASPVTVAAGMDSVICCHRRCCQLFRWVSISGRWLKVGWDDSAKLDVPFVDTIKAKVRSATWSEADFKLALCQCILRSDHPAYVRHAQASIDVSLAGRGDQTWLVCWLWRRRPC